MNDTAHGEQISVSGSASYEHVDCEEFDVSGKATVSGDVVAERVDTSGKATVGGRLDAGHVDTSGKLSVDGHASVNELDASGKFSVGGNLDGHDVGTSGKVDVGGSLIAAEVSSSGKLSVGALTDVTDLTLSGAGDFEDVNAETFVAAGRIDADSVAADQLELTVDGTSSVGTLSGGDVVVQDTDSSAGFLKRLLSRGDGRLDVETVEAETAELDETRAETVVADEVTLGENASVDVVYTDDLDAHPDSEVGEQRPREDY